LDRSYALQPGWYPLFIGKWTTKPVFNKIGRLS
jgi:hypothetical protein